MATYELSRFPGLKKFTGGGSGNETYFYIDIDEGFAHIDVDADENTAPKDINISLVNYRKAALDSQPHLDEVGGLLSKNVSQKKLFYNF